jgi:hypothetical protein
VVVPKSNVGTENRRGCRERKGKGKRKEKERARKRIAWERGGVGGCVDGRPGLMLFPIYYHWFRSDQTRPDQVQAGSGAWMEMENRSKGNNGGPTSFSPQTQHAETW